MSTNTHHSGQSWWRARWWSHWCVFEALREREPLRVGRGERCPGVRLHWVERGASLHHLSLREMVEEHHSVERTIWTLNRTALLDFLCFSFLRLLEEFSDQHLFSLFLTVFKNMLFSVNSDPKPTSMDFVRWELIHYYRQTPDQMISNQEQSW